ncbi:hypothetical protein [Mesorhizobium sp. M0243]|uniref:hypothetical protein n=1 Tax=Mesorhizobium sp. M0243 TaxID=2956925 RepID=UPI00333C0938
MRDLGQVATSRFVEQAVEFVADSSQHRPVEHGDQRFMVNRLHHQNRLIVKSGRRRLDLLNDLAAGSPA